MVNLDYATDGELMKWGVEGDERALRALFDKYERHVMLYCAVSSRGDPERARDLAQEIWDRVFRSLGSIDPRRFQAFLATVTRNVCRTRGKQELRRRTIELLVDFELFEADEESNNDLREDDLQEKHAREQRIQAVQRVLAKVSDPQVQTIAGLKYGEPEHTAAQIAQLLGIPRGTVLVKLMRFRNAIRVDLAAALLADDPWGES